MGIFHMWQLSLTQHCVLMLFLFQFLGVNIRNKFHFSAHSCIIVHLVQFFSFVYTTFQKYIIIIYILNQCGCHYMFTTLFELGLLCSKLTENSEQNVNETNLYFAYIIQWPMLTSPYLTPSSMSTSLLFAR